MRILFVGSVPDNNYNRDAKTERLRVQEHKSLFNAAADLGRAAAAHGHTIMVGSDRVITIDHHVVRKGLFPAAVAAPKQRFFLEVYRPGDSKRPFEGIAPSNIAHFCYTRRPGFPPEARVARAKSDKRRGTPLWLYAHQSAISSADVVIAAGGGDGTRQAAFVAENLSIPVLPLASFGGGAAEAHLAMKTRFVSHSGAHHLSAEWPEFRRTAKDKTVAADRATGIITLAESLGLHSYFLSYSHKELEWCDLVQLALYDHERTTLRDRNQLRAGRPVQKKLYEAIGRAETFVLLWSKDSAASEWCEKELKIAVQLNKAGLPPHRIVLLMRDGSPLPASVSKCLALDVRSRKQTDMRVRTDHAVERMVDEERTASPIA
ncbi:MAG: hypothetical protein ACI8P0_005268 [Planctomycetaceae bacterium]|jgi:hypothetical protein